MAAAFGRSAGVVYTLSARKKYVVSRLQLGKKRVSHRRTLAKGSLLGSGGGLAVRADGKQVVVTNSERYEDEISAWTLKATLKVHRTWRGPCVPGSAAASLRGASKGKVLIADSGICTGQASLWRLHP